MDKMTDMESKMSDGEQSPLSELASLLESYASNPSLATPETLAKAAKMARDIDEGVESEDEEEGPNPYDKMEKEEGGKGVTIGIMLGKMKKGGKGNA